MNSYIKTKTTLLLALLLFGLATAFAEEQEDPEETRLREEMYKYFDTSDRLAFEDAVHQLRSYYKTMRPGKTRLSTTSTTTISIRP